MKQTDAISLLKKHKAGKCSPEEYAQLENWYLQWNEDDNTSFTEAELVQIKQEMWSGMAKPVISTIPLWRYVAVAGAAAIVVLAVWFFNNLTHHPASQPQYAHDIAPGKNGASLALADGKIIHLNDAKAGVIINSDQLIYSDGSRVDTSASLAQNVKNNRMLVASTGKGQTYTFTLPDGSKVWLNAATAIKFPATFSGANSRNVELGGEAYFEVAKDKKHPFIVKTQGQEITVLGTHFNIDAYQESQVTKTTLLEGMVRVVAKSGSVANAFTLKPGQRAVSKGADTHVDEVDAEDAIAWKEGYFTFNRETLESVMLQISRWYDVEVSYQDESIKNIQFSGSITRFGNISEILKKVELTEKVRFKIEGRKIMVNHH